MTTAVHDWDQTKLKLETLAKKHPAEIRDAGTRVTKSIATWMSDDLEERRARVVRELEVIKMACRFVELGDKPTIRSEEGAGTRAAYSEHVLIFQEISSNEGDLSEKKWFDTYLDDWASRCIDQDPKGKLAESDRKMLKAKRRRELDPAHVSDYRHRLPFQVARVLSSEMYAPIDTIRTTAQWSEIAAMALYIECPDLDAGALGLSGGLEWGSAGTPGEDIFNCRDMIRSYMDRHPDDVRKQHNDDRFWMLCERAAEHLESALSNSEGSGGAPGGAQGLTDAETLLRGWGVKGKLRERREIILRLLADLPPGERLGSGEILALGGFGTMLDHAKGYKRKCELIRYDCKMMSEIIDGGYGNGGFQVIPEKRPTVRRALGLD